MKLFTTFIIFIIGLSATAAYAEGKAVYYQKQLELPPATFRQADIETLAQNIDTIYIESVVIEALVENIDGQYVATHQLQVIMSENYDLPTRGASHDLPEPVMNPDGSVSVRILTRVNAYEDGYTFRTPLIAKVATVANSSIESASGTRPIESGTVTVVEPGVAEIRLFPGKTWPIKGSVVPMPAGVQIPAVKPAKEMFVSLVASRLEIVDGLAGKKIVKCNIASKEPPFHFTSISNQNANTDLLNNLQSMTDRAVMTLQRDHLALAQDHKELKQGQGEIKAQIPSKEEIVAEMKRSLKERGIILLDPKLATIQAPNSAK